MENLLTRNGVQSVEALRRGLDVMRAVHNAESATFTDLLHATGLAKGTLSRALKTLTENDWLTWRPETARYTMHVAPFATKGHSVYERIAHAAEGPRKKLQVSVPWPTDLSVRHGLTMQCIEGPSANCSFSTNLRALGSRPAMLRSSVGRCYLAYCTAEERGAILEGLRHSRDSADREGAKPEEINRLLREVPRQGYATRNARHTSLDSPERFGAIAVPVFDNNKVVAALAVCWSPAVLTEAQVAERFLPGLRAAADEISARLRSC